MGMMKRRRRVAWTAFWGIAVFACGAPKTAAIVDVDGSAPESEVVDASIIDALDADLDACVPTDTKKCRSDDFIALGSKCLTKCPMHNLQCDPRFWKGECTHACKTDADCQDTGSPGVCGKDDQCHRPCNPGEKPCARTHYECMGDPGHQYCASNTPNPHTGDGGDAGDDAGDDDSGAD